MQFDLSRWMITKYVHTYGASKLRNPLLVLFFCFGHGIHSSSKAN